MFIAVILSIYLAWRDVKAGYIYIMMFFGITTLLFLVFLWIKDDRNMKPVTEYIKVPISTSLELGGLFYVVGFAIPFVLQGIVRIFSSYNITNLSIPLFSAGINNAFQTFSTAEVGNSMAWKIFITMFDAGNMETFVYNFGLPIIGVLIALFTFKLPSSDGERWLFISRKWFVVIFGVMILPTLLFVLSHLMNQNYGFKEFVIAGIFLVVANISIYLFGVFVLFWAGYHQANNLLALIMEEGLGKVAEGFVSWFGLIFLIYFLLIILFLIRNSGQVFKELGWWGGN